MTRTFEGDDVSQPSGNGEDSSAYLIVAIRSRSTGVTDLAGLDLAGSDLFPH